MRKYIFPLVFLLMSCDHYGYLDITNGYEYDVIVHTFYDYNGAIFERTDVFFPEMNFFVNLSGREYKYITAIQIETQEGIMLAEYMLEYIARLRQIYGIKKNQGESWIFTEKGLFLQTHEILNRYGEDIEERYAYYRSDEAVQDLQAMMDRK
jgi:uncharacterized protein YjhX (UPF0386 family)